MRRILILLFMLTNLFGCMFDANQVSVTLKGTKLNPSATQDLSGTTVTSVQVVNNQLIINGSNLNKVSNVKVKNTTLAFNEAFSIESITANKIIANSSKAISFAVNSAFDLILSNAYASASFTIDFSLCNATLNSKAIDCSIAATDKAVLSYDSTSNTWKPRQVNGLTYIGAWDASTHATPAAQAAGSYYIVGVAGDIGGVYSVSIGDWIVSTGSAWQKIDNSTVITSVFGRTGAVTAQKGDYNLDKLADVDLTTTAPVAGKVLKYDGTNWVPSDDLTGGGAGSVSTAMIADGSITDPKIAAVAASKITGTITSSQIADGTIVNADVSATAAIDYSKLNIPAGSIPYAKLNIADGDIPSTKISGLASSIGAVIEDAINDAETGKAPTENAVFDALALKLDKTGGTVTGSLNVPAPVFATEASTKKYVDDTATTINTTVSGKVAKAGDTMSGDLTLDTQAKFKSGSYYTTVKGSASALGNYVLTLPPSGGTNGYILTTDGAGVTSWTNPATMSAGTSTVNSAAITDDSIMDIDINSAANIAQSKIAGLTTSLAGKEPTLTAGTTAQYYRGDKTWQTLNTAAVTESTNLYFTNARVLLAPLTALNTGTVGSISATDDVLTAFGKTQKQIDDINTTVSSMSGAQWSSASGNVYRATGNVGIGTNSPAYPLDVNGTITSRSLNTWGSAAYSLFKAVDPNGLLFSLGLDAGNTKLELNTQYWSMPIAFSVNNSEKMRITNSGQVGINTTSPSEALHVVGNAYVTGTLKLKDSTTNTISLAAPTSVTSYTMTLPSAAGTNGQILSTSGSGTMTWTSLPTCNAGEVLKSNGTSFSCVTDNTGAGAFTGTASRAVATDAGGALTTTSVTSAELGYVSGVTSSIQTQLNAKEPAITAGTTAQYLRGDKTLSTFATDAINSVLSTYAVGTNTAVANTDSVVGAVGKLQAQINAHSTSLSSKADLTNISQTITAAAVTGLNAPSAGSDAANRDYVDNSIAANGNWTKSGSDVYRASGNVGIGDTPSASARLYVDGYTRLNNTASTDTFEYPLELKRERSGSTPPSAGFGAGIGFTLEGFSNYSSPTAGEIGVLWENNQTNDTTDRNSYMTFSTRQSNTLNTRMKITSAGKVGIGVSSPASMLDVNGSVKIGTDGTACSASLAGAMRFNSPNIDYCNGTAWTTFSTTSSGTVTSSQIADGTIVDADISASAAIAQSKISGLTTALAALQPLDSTLTSLAAFNANGIMVQTAADTFTARTITGTANRLTVTNGNGVSNNPTLDIDTTLLPSPVAGDAGKYLKATGANTSVWTSMASDILSTVLSTFTVGSGTKPAVTSSDTIVGAFGKVQKSINDINSDYVSKTDNTSANTVTGQITFNSIGTLNIGYTPTNATDATSKTYVDNLVATGTNQWTASSGNVYRSTGNVGIGTSSPTFLLDVQGTSGGMAQTRSVASAAGPDFYLQKDRGASVGSPAIISNGDSLGHLNFRGYDGATYIRGARISAITSAAPATNSMTTDMMFYTNNASSDATERMRIKANGNVGIGGSATNAKLYISDLDTGNSYGIYDYLTSIDLASVGHYVRHNAKFNTTGTYSPSALNVNFDATAATGVTNSGIGYAAYISAFRNSLAAATDDGGSLYSLYGAKFMYGHGNTNTGSSPTTTNAIGIGVYPFMQTGTVTTMYDLYLGGLSTGGTVTGTHYGIYQADNTSVSKNYLAAPLGVGVVPSGYMFDIAGATSATARIKSASNDATGATLKLTEDTIENGGFIRYQATNNSLDLGVLLSGAETTSVSILRSNGYVGIGTTSPTSLLDVMSGITLHDHSDTTNGAGVAVKKSRGTSSAPTQVLNGDRLFGVYVNGYHSGGAYSGNVGAIQILAAEDFTATNQGTSIDFGTTPIGSTSRSTRMTLNNAGYLGIGTTSPQRFLDVAGEIVAQGRVSLTQYSTASSANVATWHIDNNADTFRIFRQPNLTNGGVEKFTITSAGNATLAGTLTQSSDARLKTNIEKIPNALDKLITLDGIFYNWKDQSRGKEKQMGLLAQNVQKVFPEAVKKNQDGYLSVAYQNLVAPIIEALKEIKAWMIGTDKKLESQTREIASLKAQNEQIQKENAALKKDIDEIKKSLKKK